MTPAIIQNKKLTVALLGRIPTYIYLGTKEYTELERCFNNLIHKRREYRNVTLEDISIGRGERGIWGTIFELKIYRVMCSTHCEVY